MSTGQFEFLRLINQLIRFPHGDARTRLKWIVIIFAAFLLFLFLFSGPYGLINLYKLNVEKRRLTAEIITLQHEGDSLRQAIQRIQTDPREIERIAREYYGMAKKNEKVFRFAPANPDKKD